MLYLPIGQQVMVNNFSDGEGSVKDIVFSNIHPQKDPRIKGN